MLWRRMGRRQAAPGFSGPGVAPDLRGRIRRIMPLLLPRDRPGPGLAWVAVCPDLQPQTGATVLCPGLSLMIICAPQGIGLRDTTGFAAPVGGGVRVESLQALAKGFRLMTSAGEINARVVVVCTGHPSTRTSRPGRPAFRPGCQCSMRPSTTTGTTTARTGADRRQRAGRVSISGGTAPGRSRRVPVLRPRAMGAAAGTTRTPLSGSPGGVDEPDPGRPAQPGGTADG